MPRLVAGAPRTSTSVGAVAGAPRTSASVGAVAGALAPQPAGSTSTGESVVEQGGGASDERPSRPRSAQRPQPSRRPPQRPLRRVRRTSAARRSWSGWPATWPVQMRSSSRAPARTGSCPRDGRGDGRDDGLARRGGRRHLRVTTLDRDILQAADVVLTAEAAHHVHPRRAASSCSARSSPSTAFAEAVGRVDPALSGHELLTEAAPPGAADALAGRPRPLPPRPGRRRSGRGRDRGLLRVVVPPSPEPGVRLMSDLITITALSILVGRLPGRDRRRPDRDGRRRADDRPH